MGLPVVTTHHSGIPELVADGRSGYLVAEKDVDGLFDKLKHLAGTPHLWADMGRHGRQIVEDQFDINVLNDKLVEMYRSI